MLDCPIDFVAATTLEWGGGVKEHKDVRDRNILFSKHSVSTLFARDCRFYKQTFASVILAASGKKNVRNWLNSRTLQLPA